MAHLSLLLRRWKLAGKMATRKGNTTAWTAWIDMDQSTEKSELQIEACVTTDEMFKASKDPCKCPFVIHCVLESSLMK